MQEVFSLPADADVVFVLDAHGYVSLLVPVPFHLPEPLAGVTTETFHVFDLSAPPPATLVARLLRVHGHDRPWLAPFIRHGKTLSGPSDHRRTVAEWICGDREAE